MKNLLKNDSGIINIWVDSLLGLVIIIIAYSWGMPFLWMIANTTMSMGAPAGTALFLMKMVRWGLIAMAVTMILLPFAWTYYKTYDQGQANQGYFR